MIGSKETKCTLDNIRLTIDTIYLQDRVVFALGLIIISELELKDAVRVWAGLQTGALESQSEKMFRAVTTYLTVLGYHIQEGSAAAQRGPEGVSLGSYGLGVEFTIPN